MRGAKIFSQALNEKMNNAVIILFLLPTIVFTMVATVHDLPAGEQLPASIQKTVDAAHAAVNEVPLVDSVDERELSNNRKEEGGKRDEDSVTSSNKGVVVVPTLSNMTSFSMTQDDDGAEVTARDEALSAMSSEEESVQHVTSKPSTERAVPDLSHQEEPILAQDDGSPADGVPSPEINKPVPSKKVKAPSDNVAATLPPGEQTAPPSSEEATASPFVEEEPSSIVSDLVAFVLLDLPEEEHGGVATDDTQAQDKDTAQDMIASTVALEDVEAVTPSEKEVEAATTSEVEVEDETMLSDVVSDLMAFVLLDLPEEDQDNAKVLEKSPSGIKDTQVEHKVTSDEMVTSPAAAPIEEKADDTPFEKEEEVAAIASSLDEQELASSSMVNDLFAFVLLDLPEDEQDGADGAIENALKNAEASSQIKSPFKENVTGQPNRSLISVDMEEMVGSFVSDLMAFALLDF